ncbi:polysaccharide deacetylase family protein [Actinomadura oligospora]|uniref:polysaccharide deacetylase family protein n=1 Tax=Actinomadura oligospora TaxID=111804 RepID=UPI000A055DB4|nr:polysaccharide deacetylase family protein [Actinomadura oligospora]
MRVTPMAGVAMAGLTAGLMTAATACGSVPSADLKQQAAVRRHAPAPSPKPTAPPPRTIDCAHLKCVALTFDDGPGPYTAHLLDVLRGAGARATFFMLGENVGAHRAEVRRMVLEGHQLGNHTWSHPVLTELSSGAVRSEVRRTQKAIRDASGGVTPTLFRPPYGATNARVGRAVGMPEIVWDVDSLDWRYHDVARNVRVGTREPGKGSVVLFHDIHRTTVQAIPRVLAGLKKRGFTFVTVGELTAGRRLAAGRTFPAWS